MLDVSAKTTTLRQAKAEGFVRIRPEALARLRAGDTPKPDVLATARAAGLLGAKRTPDLVPHCHPIPLESVSLVLGIEEEGVRVCAEVAAVYRTGVEIEALCAVQTACLTVYDMLKALDRGMVIEAVRVLEKSGGKGDYDFQVGPQYRAAVVVASDRVSRGTAQDRSGRWLVERLKEMGVADPSYHVLPDDEERLRSLFLDLHDQGMDLVLSTGGTGLSPRDRTVEALRPVLERELPGAMEAARAYGQERTPYAFLSRGVAGHRGKTLYAALPGSTGGVRDSFQALIPGLLHARRILAEPVTA